MPLLSIIPAVDIGARCPRRRSRSTWRCGFMHRSQWHWQANGTRRRSSGPVHCQALEPSDPDRSWKRLLYRTRQGLRNRVL